MAVLFKELTTAGRDDNRRYAQGTNRASTSCVNQAICGHETADASHEGIGSQQKALQNVTFIDTVTCNNLLNKHHTGIFSTLFHFVYWQSATLLYWRPDFIR